MVDLRPLSLGEIIDRSASFWRANWRALFKLFLGFQLGQFVLLKGWEVLLRQYVPLARGGAATIEALKTQPEEALRQLGVMGVTAGVMMLIYLVVANFSAVAGAHYAWPRMLGRTSTLEGALQRAGSRAGTMFAYFGLMFGWTLVIWALLMLPAAAAIAAGILVGQGPASVALVIFGSLLAMVGMGVAAVWWVLRFLLAAQVLALEDVGARGVFRRCDALASGRIGEGFLGLVKIRLAIVVTVVSVILFSVSIVFGLPALVIQGIYGNVLDPTHATPEAVPQLLLVPAQLLQVFAQAVISPLFVVFTNVFYTDMRVRREGLDLELKLSEAKA